MRNKQTIFVSAYPKSGSTWLTRLLADILNSPSAGCMPSEDRNEVATEGQGRPGPYIVRKGHFVLIDNDTGPVVPRPHRLAWRQLTDEKVVFLVRDPRDICISGAHHWRQTPEKFLDRMIKGDVARCGRWDEYVESWWYDKLNYFELEIVKYERLLNNPFQVLPTVIDLLGCAWNRVFLYEAIQRQSFSARRQKIYRNLDSIDPGSSDKELRRNNMRKGIVGDWRNHFTPQMNDKIWDEFGWMIERLGYERE